MLLRFLDCGLHLCTGLHADIETDLALEVGEQPLDEEGIEVPDFEDVVHRRIASLFFQCRKPRGIEFDCYDFGFELLDCGPDLIDALLRDMSRPDDFYFGHLPPFFRSYSPFNQIKN